MAMLEVVDKQSLKIGEGRPGPGRGAGTPNRSTRLLKDAILLAAAAADAQMQLAKSGASLKPGEPTPEGTLTGYLTWLAQEEPSSFAALLGRVLPIQIKTGGPAEGADGKMAATEDLGRAIAFALRLGLPPNGEHAKVINAEPVPVETDKPALADRPKAP